MGVDDNEGVISWNNILRSLASRNDRRMILMDIEHELRTGRKAPASQGKGQMYRIDWEKRL